MPEYKNGKIYKIWSPSHDDLQYIGSTTQELCKRMCSHRREYKKYLEGKYSYVRSFDILKFEDCRIDLLEYFPCNNKAELHKKEGEVIKSNVCVNKNIPGRSLKEWYQDNKETIKTIKKQYYIDNKERIKQYREDNKELIKTKAKQKMNCVCGSVVRKDKKMRHERSKKHIKYMQTINV